MKSFTQGWEALQLSISGEVWLHIEGLVENRQAFFEDVVLCREALNWCLLLVARIAQSIDLTDIGGFMFFRTANFLLSRCCVIRAAIFAGTPA